MHLRRATPILLATTVLLLGACGTEDVTGSKGEGEDVSKDATATVQEEDVEEGKVDEREVELEPVGNSDLSGTASVSADEAGKVVVKIELRGETETHGAAAVVGKCEDQGGEEGLLGDAAKFTLLDIEDGTMAAEVEIPDEVLNEGEYALVVYDGPEDEGDPAACAQVTVQ